MPPPKTYHSQQYDTATHNRLTNRDLCGGGNFITQAHPTNFHEFATRKILTPGDTVDNYREVTAEQKATIEAADAKWEKPGDWLIEQAESNGAVYNAATGFFELNGLVDITAAEMEDIIKFLGRALKDQAFCNSPIRTNTQLVIIGTGIQSPSCARAFFGCTDLEVINFMTSRGYTIIGNCDAIFQLCKSLRAILGVVMFNHSSVLTAFKGCTSLESFTFKLRYNLDLSDCPNVSDTSISSTIAESEGNNNITITLRPDAYARVTDEIFAAAAEKNITLATTA